MSRKIDGAIMKIGDGAIQKGPRAPAWGRGFWFAGIGKHAGFLKAVRRRTWNLWKISAN
jgi:hypothetical protein